MKLYKLVVRDKNGKVIQIHETISTRAILDKIRDETDKGYSITVTKLSN